MNRAVIFDFDGVIADTESLHWRAFQHVLEPVGLGISWDDYVAELIGYDDRDAYRVIYGRGGKALDPEEMAGLIGRKAEAFMALATADGDVLYPGAPELIHTLADAGWALAICSGSLRKDIEAILHGTELLNQFDVVVTSDDVTVSKPNPESYHQAVERLGLPPDRAVVIEDTPAGITAARGAGLRVVGITTTHKGAVLSDADVIVSGIGDLSPDVLARVLD
jgi:beta-phosphoglucomutase